VKWLVLDFLAFPLPHRATSTPPRAVQGGLPLACAWCGHWWTLAQDASALRRMQARAWVRLFLRAFAFAFAFVWRARALTHRPTAASPFSRLAARLSFFAFFFCKVFFFLVSYLL
jgi:hypothetical protein